MSSQLFTGTAPSVTYSYNASSCIICPDSPCPCFCGFDLPEPDISLDQAGSSNTSNRITCSALPGSPYKDTDSPKPGISDLVPIQEASPTWFKSGSSSTLSDAHEASPSNDGLESARPTPFLFSCTFCTKAFKRLCDLRYVLL